MNYFKIFITVILLTAISFAHAEELQASHDFDLPSKSSNIRLSDFRGKIVYLDFWASWCGPCKQSFPWMNAMHEKYKSEGLVVLAINLDSNIEDAHKFLSSNNANFSVAFDNKGATPRTYSVKGMPSSFIISREGKIIFQHVGFNENDKNKLEQKIIESLKAK